MGDPIRDCIFCGWPELDADVGAYDSRNSEGGETAEEFRKRSINEMVAEVPDLVPRAKSHGDKRASGDAPGRNAGRGG